MVSGSAVFGADRGRAEGSFMVVEHSRGGLLLGNGRAPEPKGMNHLRVPTFIVFMGRELFLPAPAHGCNARQQKTRARQLQN